MNTDGDVLMPEEILEWDVVSIYYDLPRTYNNKKIISKFNLLSANTKLCFNKIKKKL